MLVDREAAYVETWTRGPSGWAAARFGPGAVVPLEAIDCRLPVDEVFAAAVGA